ncbi:MAG TPA: hypothetical protein VFH77_08710 [Streptomyces sp.]|nr:hypothetical protein [Streptomyces sp.]
MKLATRARHVPPRIAAGAFILSSGLSKLEKIDDDQTAEGLHGMARGTYPFLDQLPPRTFLKVLCGSEIALGAALLALPVVPTALAGAGLSAFSGSLLGIYLRAPGMRREGSLAPTDAGMPMAKDVWMLGIGLGFLTDAVVTRLTRRR